MTDALTPRSKLPFRYTSLMAQPFSPPPYEFDPEDPRAPTLEQWAQMTPEERARAVEVLPAEVPIDIMAPEGDPHRKAKESPLQAMDAFFQRVGRKVYLSSELSVYYPGEPRIVPDVFAVLDVETHERMKWVVAIEGRGLDLVIEVHVAGDHRKVHEDKVALYARLGIAEYFIFDRGRMELTGHRLAPGAGKYERIVPHRDRLLSRVLGLGLVPEGAKLRFYDGETALPDTGDLVTRLTRTLDAVVAGKEAAERAAHQAELHAKREAERAERAELHAKREAERAEREAKRAEREAERAADLERRLREADAELARLARGR